MFARTAAEEEDQIQRLVAAAKREAEKARKKRKRAKKKRKGAKKEQETTTIAQVVSPVHAARLQSLAPALAVGRAVDRASPYNRTIFTPLRWRIAWCRAR